MLAIFFAGVFCVSADELAWPPITSQNRPWTWWWWHGSAVDKTNLARELREFHDAGLGGVQVTTIYGVKGVESRDIPYLSPRWLDMLDFTVDEAGDLNMGVTMTLGSGWCFGGPTVSRQDANASVVVKTYPLGVGEKMEQKFDPQTTQALMAFSSDGQVVDLTDKISAGGSVNWVAPSNAVPLTLTLSPKGAREHRQSASTDSSLAPTGGEGRGEGTAWTVYAISQKPSGQKVKRAAPGGEGWMLNPLYPQAMTNWLKWFDGKFTGGASVPTSRVGTNLNMFAAREDARPTGAKPLAVFQDSYEYRTDWSPDFFAQFEKLRGYKLQDELPALFAGSRLNDSTIQRFTNADEIARVKYDYRRTVSEIMAEETEPAWIAWAHQNGFQTIYQAHGTPGNWLDLYGDADMPETEMFHLDRNILISKFASSAAHTQGRQLVGAETGTWLAEHFTVTLADLKFLADDMFLSGVNRIFYHGACYSPADAPWPGWVFYASTEMNPRNSIWRDVPALNHYIARVQSILQSGRPDNDILLYWPVADFWSDPRGLLQPMTVSATDWFKNQPIGRTAGELWNDGYTFDYVSDAQLLKAKVADGKIQMPGGDYKVIVVPACKFMPFQTFTNLVALEKMGATIIFQSPTSTAAGLLNSKKQTDQMVNLWRHELMLNQFALGGGKLGDTKNAFGLAYNTNGAGRIILPEGPDSLCKFALRFCGVTNEMMSENGLSFIRRKFDGGWNYFIANRGTNHFDGWITLARPAKSVEILDAMTGNSGIAAQNENGQIHLQLAAGESVILRVFANQKVEGSAWNYFQTNGAPVDISGDWNVKFISGGPTLPTNLQITNLESWTKFADTNCQAFAGTAKYEITFDLKNSKLKTQNSKFFLDLGDVRQSARVELNGKDYGTLIAPPFRVVVNNLKPTGNQLEVEVTSVAANRIRDLDRRGVNWKIFKDINIVNENYRPFDASHWPLTDCGLLGPVTLTPLRAE